MYRTIQTETWEDPWFLDLIPPAKLLFLYLITNTRTSACGAAELSLRYVSITTGLDLDAIRDAIAELERDGRVRYFPEHNLFVLRNFYRHQLAQSSAKYTIAARKAAAKLPPIAYAWVIELYPDLEYPTDTLPIPYVEGIPTFEKPRLTEQNRAETEQSRTEQGERARAKKPDALPKDFAPTANDRAWAETMPGMTPAIVDQMTRKFVGHYVSRGDRLVDWDAKWRVWAERESTQFIPKEKAATARAPTRNGGRTTEDMMAMARELEEKGL